MADNAPIDRPNLRPTTGPDKVSPTRPTGSARKSDEARSAPAFKALLDKLQQQARNLQAESETVARPDELSSAVDRARSSLDDALSLSDRLLEAFRETMHQDGAERSPDTEG